MRNEKGWSFDARLGEEEGKKGGIVSTIIYGEF